MAGKTVDVQAEPDPMPVAGQRPGPPFFAVLLVAGMIVICAGLQSAASIVAPVFLALTLVLTIRPLVTWLNRHHVPKLLSGFIGLMAVYVVLALILLAIVFARSLRIRGRGR